MQLSPCCLDPGHWIDYVVHGGIGIRRASEGGQGIVLSWRRSILARSCSCPKTLNELGDLTDLTCVDRMDCFAQAEVMAMSKGWVGASAIGEGQFAGP